MNVALWRRDRSSAVPAGVWQVAGVIVLGAFMSNLDTSLVNVGLATIGRQLHCPLGSAQWITDGYLLALAATLPVCGWLGRRIGVGRLWLWSLAAFTVASGLCALAQSADVLIALRVVQGMAGGLLTPAGQTIIGHAAGPGRMGRVMNTVGVAIVLAPALGPTIGGVLIVHLSWRWLFLINLPVGGLALALGLRIVPPGRPGLAGRLDRPGLLLVSCGLPLVSYGIITAGVQRHLSASTLATLVAGLAGLALFGRRCLHHAAPLLDLRLFGSRVYATAELSVLFTGAALFGGMIVFPLYFQLLRGQSVLATGLLLLTFGVGAGVATCIGGRLTDRIGGGITATAGLAVTAASTIPFALLGGDADFAVVESLLFVRGIGLGLAGLPAVSVAYATVPRDKLPDATSQTNIIRRVGGALGGALFIAILQDRGARSEAAFHVTFWWLAVAAVASLVLTSWLAVEERLAGDREPRAGTVAAGDPGDRHHRATRTGSKITPRTAPSGDAHAGRSA